MLLLLLLLLQAGPDPCGPEARAALTRAAERRDREGIPAARAELVAALGKAPQCVPLGVAAWAVSGWLEARKAAPKGGAPEAIAPAQTAAAVLDRLMSRPAARVENTYARTAIAAAIAAAQDERSDLGLYLTHARGLSEQLALAGVTADWPLPIDALDGELWLEVDRYEESRDAYTRAVEHQPTPLALVGLARANERLKDAAAACDAYRRALTRAAGPLAIEARAGLDRRACRR